MNGREKFILQVLNEKIDKLYCPIISDIYEFCLVYGPLTPASASAKNTHPFYRSVDAFPYGTYPA